MTANFLFQSRVQKWMLPVPYPPWQCPWSSEWTVTAQEEFHGKETKPKLWVEIAKNYVHHREGEACLNKHEYFCSDNIYARLSFSFTWTLQTANCQPLGLTPFHTFPSWPAPSVLSSEMFLSFCLVPLGSYYYSCSFWEYFTFTSMVIMQKG